MMKFHGERLRDKFEKNSDLEIKTIVVRATHTGMHTALDFVK